MYLVYGNRKMDGMKTFFASAAKILSILTDWFLIAAGVLMIVKALVSVDVPIARYVIIALGIILSGSGLWYRHRRKTSNR